MTTERVFLAADLGAESGRVVAGRYDGNRLILEEIHRFLNITTELNGSLHWNIQQLYHEIKQGIRMGVERFGDKVQSVGIDTWGCDYGLLDKNWRLCGTPHCYRDERVNGIEERLYKKISREDLYGNTGIQTVFVNSGLHLFAQVEAEDPRLAAAEHLLFVPDLLNFWLSGEAAQEYSVASTSQLLDMRTGEWSKPVLDALGIPERLFSPVIQPGTKLGTLRPALQEELRCGPLDVITVAGHDTASAVAAVPTDGSQSFAFMSSGTWSLMGLEATAPSVDSETLELGFTNEGGVCNTIRKLRNISGLWLIQECKRAWARDGKDFDYDTLTTMAAESEPFAAVIDADHAPFIAPGNMPDKIAAFCEATGQEPPKDPGSTVRTALESLALKYRVTFDRLEALAGKRLEVLHIVGGGTQNKLLNQMAADALNRRVITGPVEATACGNLLMQLVAQGEVEDLAAARALVRASFDVEIFDPVAPEAWDAPLAKLATFCEISV